MTDEFVHVFDSTLFPTGVSVSVVEFGVESALDEFGIEEFGTRVGGDGVDFESFE